MDITYVGVFLISFAIGLFSWGLVLFIQDLLKEDEN